VLLRESNIKNQNIKISVIKNAAHSFKGCETELAKSVESFIKEILITDCP